MVEHNLAKVGVAGSNPVFRSTPHQAAPRLTNPPLGSARVPNTDQKHTMVLPALQASALVIPRFDQYCCSRQIFAFSLNNVFAPRKASSPCHAAAIGVGTILASGHHPKPQGHSICQ